MSYECVYCGSELVYEDTWGVVPYWKQDNKSEGDIFRCPNHEGFEDKDEAINYLKQQGQYDEFFLSNFTWEDVVCESNCHYVSGMFYTDRNEDLHEGYPC